MTRNVLGPLGEKASCCFEPLCSTMRACQRVYQEIKQKQMGNTVIGLETLLESAKLVLREAYLVHRIARSSASASSDPMSRVCPKDHTVAFLKRVQVANIAGN